MEGSDWVQASFHSTPTQQLPNYSIVRYDRRHSDAASGGFAGSSMDPRSPGAKDRDRILYSDPFRRLTGVTQVVGAHEGPVFHNRFTHSVKVGQIARRLAEKVRAEHEHTETTHLLDALGGLDPEVAEAAALAHDIGHPPFGHTGEEILDRLVRERGCHEGFEGNAQSFRIITKIAFKGEDPDNPPGLDLCRATLRGTLKYPWLRELDIDHRPIPYNKRSKKWSVYESERTDFEFAMEMQPPPNGEQSLETCIMDWADDITYAVHDLEDFYRAGLIPLSTLIYSLDAREEFLNRVTTDTELDDEETLTAFEKIEDLLPDTPFTGQVSQIGELAVMRTRMIEGLVNAFGVSATSGEISINESDRNLVEVLKKFTWYYVIKSPDLESQRYGHQRIISEIFEAFYHAEKYDTNLEESQYLNSPFFDRSIFMQCHPARLAADYITSLSEAQAIQLYGRLTGHTLGSVRDLIV